MEQHPTAVTRPVHDRIRDELMDQWMRDTPKRILIVPLCALLVAVALHGAAPTVWLLLWLTTIAMISVWRLLLYRYYWRAAGDAASRIAHARSKGVLNQMVVCVTALGVAWGMSMVLGFHYGSQEPALLATVGVITAGMAVVTIGGMFPLAGLMMTLGIFAPFEVWSLWLADRQVLMLAFGGLVYIAILVVWSRSLFRNVVETMLLRHEKDGLVLELRRAKEDAERANLEKSRFLAAASHDLRQPMQSLWLFVGNLRRHWGQPQALQTLDSIENALEAMRALFDSLLSIAQFDAGGVHASPRAVPIQPSLDRLRDGFSGECDLKSLRFTVWPSNAWVDTDPVLLDRILFNLLSNAIKYTPSGGGILVGCRKRGQALEVQVWDTGIGIDQDHQHMVFEEFVQLANPERDRSKGLGLGLAIARRLADLLGARLQMRSQRHRGSMFSVTVPQPPAQANPAANAQDAAVPHLAGLTVGVVEDEPAILEAVRQFCETRGVHFFGGHDLPSLRAAMQGATPDIVLSDYCLAGGENGLQTISQARKLWPRVRAVLLTGEVLPSLLDEARSLDVELLYKPVSPGTLAQTFTALAPSVLPPVRPASGSSP